jgi:hypothetical protein
MGGFGHSCYLSCYQMRGRWLLFAEQNGRPSPPFSFLAHLYAAGGQKNSSLGWLARKDPWKCFAPPTVGDHGHTPTIHGNFSGFQLCDHAATSGLRRPARQSSQLGCEFCNQRDHSERGGESIRLHLGPLSVAECPSTFARRMRASASKPLITRAASRSLSIERAASPTTPSSAVETVSFSLTMGKTPNPISFSIARRRLEYRSQLVKSSSVRRT